MKVYVTGGTGLVGSNIIKVAVERYQAEVFATVHRRKPTPSMDYAYGTVDTHFRDQVLHSVRAFRPDVIVHCAVLLDLPLIYRDRELGWQSYVEATGHLVEAANDVGAKIVLISSDWVFDGTQAMADETTPPNPINYYGVLKVVGETLLAARAKDWAVVRVAGVNGVHWARPELALTQNAGFGNLAVAVAETLGRNRPFTVWEGEVNMQGTPTLASEIGEMILRIIELDRQGIFHCCATVRTTRRELALATARVFDLDTGLIRFGPPDPADFASLTGFPVPKDTSLSCDSTAQRLSYQPLDLFQTLGKLREQMETGCI
ncbi:MAG: sugar nucleotide-binding protein [Anaerolineae bacterium]|jgi:dTDP-4-dehydrorhamnose reductase